METLISLGKSWRKYHLKHSIDTKRDGKSLQRKYKINDEVIWRTDTSHTLLCEWSVGDWLQWIIRKGSSRISSKYIPEVVAGS